jgi:anti-sigma regulatory factor (Ser/Thr protein kinase)
MTPLRAPISLLRAMPSHLTAVEAVCRDVRGWLEANGLSAVGFAVELTTRECLCNAVVHGNAGRADARVTLSLRIGRRWIRVQVADEGRGFPWRSATKSPPEGTQEHGRGLAICALYASRVAFNRSGSRITLWIAKRKGADRA